LAYSLPHTLFHYLNLEPYARGDVIANVVGLAATVIVPIVLLALLLRPAVSAPDGPDRQEPSG
jgi:hypothetical protein